jgi:hypothetical protein
LGDLSYAGAPESAWCDFVKAHVGPTFPFELIAGNHDADNAPAHIQNFTPCLPDRIGGVVGTYGKEYYFDYLGLARVISLVPNLRLDGQLISYAKGTPHAAFVAQAIDDARTKGLPWVIVAMHEPCQGINRQFACYPGGNDLVDLLVSKKVDLVLQGHYHDYQRGKQLAISPSCPTIPVQAFNSACIKNDGRKGVYQKGAGTVFMIVGTGGDSLGPIDLDHPEGNDFIQWMGSTISPRFGVFQASVSASALGASSRRPSATASTRRRASRASFRARCRRRAGSERRSRWGRRRSASSRSWPHRSRWRRSRRPWRPAECARPPPSVRALATRGRCE